MKTNMQKTIIAALFIAPVAAFAKDKDKWEYHEGNSIDWSGTKVPVKIAVNFADATWSDSWNNGKYLQER